MKGGDRAVRGDYALRHDHDEQRGDRTVPDPSAPHVQKIATSARVDLANRLALRPREAAECLGVSESTLRRLTPTLPHVREGGVLLFPVRGLALWLEERAKAGESAVDGAVREILDSLE